MRKTFAVGVHSRLGYDLRKTQLALGQRDINATIRYLPVHQDEIDQAVRSLTLGPPATPAYPEMGLQALLQDNRTYAIT